MKIVRKMPYRDARIEQKGAIMAFGQQPQGNNAQNNGFNNQYQYNQQYNQYNAQPQYAYAPNGTAAVNVQATYSYEQAERSSVNSAYTHMTLGLIVTAVVAIITQMSRRVPGTHPNHGHHRHLRPRRH